ncbi:MAG: hypothetical protein IT210_10175 [Armatimonadetes bacterium]|nr:hypothetical protein [Armatimonadota bacterium]
MAVASIRLLPSPLREYIWSAETWRIYRHNHEARMRIFRSLLPELWSFLDHMPLIVGGDFNAPAGDAVYLLMEPRLKDSFCEAGRG